MGSPALRDMDSRSQTGKSSIHGAGRRCGERAKVTLEVGE
jgi:hypothetical protein